MQTPAYTHEVQATDGTWHPITAMQAAAYRAQGANVRKIEKSSAQ